MLNEKKSMQGWFTYKTLMDFCYTGESGLVYCGYLDSKGGRDMVAIKTCKGKDHQLQLLQTVKVMSLFSPSRCKC